jgi:MFS family permease
VNEQGAKRNVLLLMAAQGMLFINNTTMIAVNGLVGFSIAPNALLATLSVTAYVIGAAIASAPVARMMSVYGRKTGFTVGGIFGIVGAMISAYAVSQSNFWLLCFGTLIVGVYNACGALYRFAAAEVAPPSMKERAISFVLAGGILGGVVGPNLANHTKDLTAAPFAASYAALVFFGLIGILLIRLVQFPQAESKSGVDAGRPLKEIMAQPVFIVAALGATIGYGIMNLLMTATPIAMKTCKLPFSDTAIVLEWHVIAMFAPSFFTGSLIKRFGVLNIMFTGALLMFVCVAVALNGIDFMNFLIALIVLGVGWNFLFVGGTTLLTEAYRPEEKNKVQGANDFLVFLTMATSSFSSGALVSTRGWDILNYGALPFLCVVSLALLWLMRVRARAVAT